MDVRVTHSVLFPGGSTECREQVPAGTKLVL